MSKLEDKLEVCEGCFIATVVYGTPLASEITMLRKFRDRLNTNTVGKLFVKTYYTMGPYAAKLISRRESLKKTTRHCLGPLVDMLRRYYK